MSVRAALRGRRRLVRRGAGALVGVDGGGDVRDERTSTSRGMGGGGVLGIEEGCQATVWRWRCLRHMLVVKHRAAECARHAEPAGRRLARSGAARVESKGIAMCGIVAGGAGGDATSRGGWVV